MSQNKPAVPKFLFCFVPALRILTNKLFPLELLTLLDKSTHSLPPPLVFLPHSSVPLHSLLHCFFSLVGCCASAPQPTPYVFLGPLLPASSLHVLTSLSLWKSLIPMLVFPFPPTKAPTSTNSGLPTVFPPQGTLLCLHPSELCFWLHTCHTATCCCSTPCKNECQ